MLEGAGPEMIIGAHANLESFLCPELALLRYHVDPVQLNTAWFASSVIRKCLCLDPSRIDRLACLQFMRDSTVAPYDSWLAAQLLDSVRHSDETQSSVSIDSAVCNDQCNELTLSINPLHIQSLDLSFFGSLSSIDIPLLYLLSKVIPQRCQGRKFSVVALRSISTPRVSRQLQELVLCALLGNYTCSDPLSRPGPDIRAKLFSLLRCGNASPWLVMLLEKCRGVVMYCMREHVVFSVEQQPAVRAQVGALMQFQEFQSVVRSAMSALRNYVQGMLSSSDSSLFRATYEQSPCDRWIHEIDFLLQPFDAAILKLSYRRPKQSFRQFLLSVGNKSDGEEIPHLVTRDEIVALRGLSERLSDNRVSALGEMVNWLELFRVAPEIVAVVRMVMVHHAQGDTSLDRLRTLLINLQEIDPRAFQILHIAAELQQHAQRITLAGRLSYNYIKFQVDACQSRFGTKHKDTSPHAMGGRVLDHVFYFFYCDVCFNTYSLLADSASPYKQDYSYGLRDAVMDHQTREVYCNRDRHSYRGSCSQQPLRRVLLLGNVLNVNGSMISICPQPKCGRIMVINSSCMTTARGRACVYCTQREQVQSITFKDLLKKYTTFAKLPSCVVCDEELKQTGDIYLYPYEVFVCRRHHSVPLVNYVNILVEEHAKEVETTEQKREELKVHIIEFTQVRQNAVRKDRIASELGRRRVAKLVQMVERKRG